MNLPAGQNAMDPVVVLAGPTGSGKTSLAMALARSSGLPPIEIINADSRQVYRGMDIGTDKLPEADRSDVPHHLLDIIDPDTRYSSADFARDAGRCIREIRIRNALPLVVGGTGLYIRVLTCGLAPLGGPNQVIRDKYRLLLEQNGPVELHEMLRMRDPVRAGTIERTDAFRVIRALELLDTGEENIAGTLNAHGFSEQRYHSLKFVLNVDREKLFNRIDERVDIMMSTGLIREVQILLQRFHRDSPGLSGIGYRQICDCLEGKLSLTEAVRLVKRDTRHFAKRQITWFRKEPDAQWIDHDPADPVKSLDRIAEGIRRFYENWRRKFDKSE